ncbi:retron system putative HNH endonuclease [Leucothrix pacifica]|uniref:TIGR02646 family protein n=1 Tax=Leucothrix pacifica TaxID=1247513 RepID=A0A317C110_9GAMM|nr:retron system putative HNH endonuclease [Leucothrix pacifica]PWQ92334.1 TIGR02646 family protein [Leucothrix pacifica]
MRYLKRHPDCKRLKNKRNNAPTDELSAKRAWRRFNKKDTRKSCYKIQQGLCAYTELSLDDRQLGSHLEHIAPRSRFPERTFLPNNLVLSILADDYSGHLPEEQRFAGHFKKSNYADDWFITPYDERCERYFEYSATTGKVYPSQDLNETDQRKATKTILALNLNCEYLVDARLKQLSALEQKITTLLANLNIDSNQPDEHAERAFTELTATVLNPTDRRLPEFYTAKQQLLKRYRSLMINHPHLPDEFAPNAPALL